MILIRGNQLFFRGQTYRCAIGKSGFSPSKSEGDGATPLGVFVLRECWYRADRMSVPLTGLPKRIIERDDGWCDDPASESYNQHIKLPFAGGHETLWREDGCYDLIVPMGYNDAPVMPGRGSAIFLHVAASDYKPTEGCIALAKVDLLAILPQLDAQAMIEIRAE